MKIIFTCNPKHNHFCPFPSTLRTSLMAVGLCVGVRGYCITEKIAMFHKDPWTHDSGPYIIWSKPHRHQKRHSGPLLYIQLTNHYSWPTSIYEDHLPHNTHNRDPFKGDTIIIGDKKLLIVYWGLNATGNWPITRVKSLLGCMKWHHRWLQPSKTHRNPIAKPNVCVNEALLFPSYFNSSN